MLIYFADRQLNILGNASTEIGAINKIIDDDTTETLEGGSISFSAKIISEVTPTTELREMIQPGYFVLKQRKETSNDYDVLFQIIDVEYESVGEISLYSEDVGLEFINKIVEPVKLDNLDVVGMIKHFVPLEWSVYNLTGDSRKKTYEWLGQNSLRERIISISNLFGVDVQYGFTIEDDEILNKAMYVVSRINAPEDRLTLNYPIDINSLTVKTTMQNFCTAIKPVGKDNLNLKGYTWAGKDILRNGMINQYRLNPSTGEIINRTMSGLHGTILNEDGLFQQFWMYSTDSKEELANQACARLRELDYRQETYEIELEKLPDSTALGDVLNIVSHKDNIYTSARVSKISKSITRATTDVVLTYYIEESEV